MDKFRSLASETYTPACSNIDLDEAKGLILQLIATVYHSPDQSFKQNLDSGRLHDALDTLCTLLDLNKPQLRVNWSDLQTAYVSLFVSNATGVPAHPYAGYVLDGQLLGQHVEALIDHYQIEGLEFSKDWNDLPDHIAAIAEAALLLHETCRHTAVNHLIKKYLFPWFEHYKFALQTADMSGFYGPLTVFLSQALMEVTHDSKT